jgi:hypothetical protein
MFGEDSGDLPEPQGINASGNPVLGVKFIGC